MSEKPEALRLAERIDLRDYYDFDAALHCPDAAIQLRRLHAENERLREALTYDWDQLEACRESLREHMVEIKRLREALSSIAEIDLRGVSLLAAGSVLLKVVDKAKAALRREDKT